MPDTFERLKAALADRYAIEHELGSAGMATVDLAEDLKHHRCLLHPRHPTRVVLTLYGDLPFLTVSHDVPPGARGGRSGRHRAVGRHGEGETWLRPAARRINDAHECDAVGAYTTSCSTRGTLRADVGIADPDPVLYSDRHILERDLPAVRRCGTHVDTREAPPTGVDMRLPNSLHATRELRCHGRVDRRRRRVNEADYPVLQTQGVVIASGEE